MTNPEFIQSAGTAINQVKEVFDATAKINLLQTLTDLGHPYGLMVSAETASAPWLYCSSASSSVGADWSQSFDETSIFTPYWLSVSGGKWLLCAKSGVGDEDFISGLPSSRRSVGSSNSLEESFLTGPKANEHRISIFASLLTGFKFFGFKNESGLGYKDKFGLTVLAPGTLKSLTELGERPRNLWIKKNHLGLGTSSIHLGTFKGEAPYLVKTPQGEVLTQINPGDPVGSIHVSGQAGLLRNLSPLQKAEQITQDFIDLFRAVDQTVTSGLDANQQAVIARAQTATLIGISHLVRLFRHRTGLPTWKLDVLPDLVQRFHQHDSQVVSRAFGGTRKVRVSDVEMMVVTPTMRQQLVATV